MDNFTTGGRKRIQSNQNVDDHALDQIAKQAEGRLAARRQARAEAKEIRMREIERQQRDAEENADKVFDMFSSVDNSSRNVRNTPNTNNKNSSLMSSPLSNNSRRSSEDSLEESVNYRDVKLEIKELEEKFRKAMIQNAQLDNEKSSYSYQVELYKDRFQELEESLSVMQKDYKDKCREHEQLKRLVINLKEDLQFFRVQLEERDRLLEEQGLIVSISNNDNETPESTDVESKVDFKRKLLSRVLISPQSAELLQILGEGPLDVRLKKYSQERKDLSDEVTKLRIELEEERMKKSNYHMMNGSDNEDFDETRESFRSPGDYKFKWQKAEQDISTLQANIARLESQVIRYKSAAETSEKVEDGLKVEKRKLQRELREAQSRVEELETANTHLQRRLDKLKNAKSALLKEI